MNAPFRIGIDIGGTFTDVVVADGDGVLHLFKTESTPRALLEGVLEGVGLAARALERTPRELLGETTLFGHGTTAATNAYLERKGMKTGLLTTKGFGDTLFIQRMMGATEGLGEDEILNYVLRAAPEPLIPPRLVKEVTERVDFRGDEILPLDLGEAEQAIRELQSEGVEALAVCFLWGFKNPSHEQAVRELAARLTPQLYVSLSSEVTPVIGEYERTATTAINAYLAPPVSRYLADLGQGLRSQGYGGPILLLNSRGGVFSPEEASRRVADLLLSGPTGGVIASVTLGELLGHREIITTDMGGTSFDVGLIVEGRPEIRTASAVGKYHLLLPMIDITTIGAGGGSTARTEDGYLKVGPRSAGAEPGPACYGKGGEEPTVTDADVVLGFINPEGFLGGRLRLDRAHAERAIEEKVAGPLGLTLLEAAAGIRRIVDQQMADLLRKVTIERGHDPREFVLYSYGGAGPTHCTAYGAELQVRAIVIPATATVHSAYGAVAADLFLSFEHSDLMRTPPRFTRASDSLDPARITANFHRLEEQGQRALERHGLPREAILFRRQVDMRFRRQTHDLVLPVPPGELGAEDMDALVANFERKYEELYGEGSAFREAGVEITTFRVDAIGRIPKPRLRRYPSGGPSPRAALKGERPAGFGETGELVATPIYAGEALVPDNLIPGPAIIEYPGTTAVIAPGQRALVDSFLNLILEVGDGR